MISIFSLLTSLLPLTGFAAGAGTGAEGPTGVDAAGAATGRPAGLARGGDATLGLAAVAGAAGGSPLGWLVAG